MNLLRTSLSRARLMLPLTGLLHIACIKESSANKPDPVWQQRVCEALVIRTTECGEDLDTLLKFSNRCDMFKHRIKNPKLTAELVLTAPCGHVLEHLKAGLLRTGTNQAGTKK